MSDYEVVAVGTDGSSSATAAVTRAAQVAADSGARLLIICVYEGVGQARVRRDPDQTERATGAEAYAVIGSSRAEQTLRTAHDIAREAGAGEIETVAVEGDVTGAICDEVERRRADLVVVGNKGLASFAGRLLGSVPAEVSRRSSTDVLIVHTT